MLKIANKDVLNINVMEENDGEIKTFSVNQQQNIQSLLREIYNFIKECKKADIEIGFNKNELKYYIELETGDKIYSPYKIIKHRNGKFSIERKGE